MVNLESTRVRSFRQRGRVRIHDYIGDECMGRQCVDRWLSMPAHTDSTFTSQPKAATVENVLMNTYARDAALGLPDRQSDLYHTRPPTIGYIDLTRLASITVNAAMLIILRTVELDVRIFTGALTPSRNGPTATLLPASVLSRL